MHLTPYFDLSEFTRSQTATRRRIPNEPTAKHRENLVALCKNVLDPLRITAGCPIRISSGYRSLELNAAVRGSITSQHCSGEAADFMIDGYTVRETIGLMRSLDLPFDQLIDEFGQWVHVSYGPRHRRQVLEARHVGRVTRYTDIT